MTIIQISQLIISLSVIFVWTVRYKNVQKEFELFGIKKIIKPIGITKFLLISRHFKNISLYQGDAVEIFKKEERCDVLFLNPPRAGASAAVIQAQIEANMYYLPKLDARDPFAHLRDIKQPTFILNGVDDVMIPSINSWHMAQNIPNAQLFIYPDAGHAAQFQFPERFLKHAIQFLGE